MTKRTAEQTLRDEIDRANRLYSKAGDDYERARLHVAEATKLLEETRQIVESARTKVLRAEAALEALLGETPALPGLEETPATELSADELAGLEVLAERDREEERVQAIAAASGTDPDVVRSATRSRRAAE